MMPPQCLAPLLTFRNLEVAQQCRVRRKDDFVLALSPVIADATITAYRGASFDIQQRVGRVVDVWKQRSVFDDQIMADVETRLREFDKTRGGNNSLSSRPHLQGPSTPNELVPAAEALAKVAKTLLPARSSLNISRENYNRVTDPSAAMPTPPVHAARLNGLIKNLAAAEKAIKESSKARKILVESLEQLLGFVKRDLETDTKHLGEVLSRKAEMESKKAEVEMTILRSLSSEKPKSPEEAPGPGMSEPPEPDRPEVEALTPPPADNSGPFEPPTAEPARHVETLGRELLSNVASQYQSIPIHTNGSNKRRKVDSGEEMPDLGDDDGIDADVVEMLRKESQPS